MYDKRTMHNHPVMFIFVPVLLAVALLAFITVFVMFPIVFMYSFTLQGYLIFFRFGLPKTRDKFELPNVPGLKNFYVDVVDKETSANLTLGVWHLLPWALADAPAKKRDFDYNTSLATSGYNVCIHFHGIGETRKDSLEIFKMLRIFCHVIAFDYRGYGDSGVGKMSENALIEDCKQICEWVMTKTEANLYLWGHSIGASLALSTAARLQTDDGIVVDAVMLEAPFTNMREALPLHRLGKIFAWLPWLRLTILDPLERNGFLFENEQSIANIDCPVLIFHAGDDSVIPIQLGQKLTRSALSSRQVMQGKIVFREILPSYRCDHFRLYRYPDLPYEVRNFLISAQCGNLNYIYNHSLAMILKHWVLKRRNI